MNVFDVCNPFEVKKNILSIIYKSANLVVKNCMCNTLTVGFIDFLHDHMTSYLSIPYYIFSYYINM